MNDKRFKDHALTCQDDRTARVLDPTRLFLAAFKAGVARISARQLGPLAGVTGRTAARWLGGQTVSAESDEALRRALGIND